MSNEIIAFVDRQQALDACIVEGFTNAEDVERDALLSDIQWGERDVLDNDEEHDPNALQLISYVVIMRGDEVFLTQRLEGGGESRLHGKVSAGVGGHVEKCDAFSDHVVGVAACREVREEVDVGADENGQPRDIALRPVGYIYDPSTIVGQRHLGAVYTLQVDECAVRETDVLRGFWAEAVAERVSVPLRKGETRPESQYATCVGLRPIGIEGWGGTQPDLESWARIVLERIDTLRGAA